LQRGGAKEETEKPGPVAFATPRSSDVYSPRVEFGKPEASNAKRTGFVELTSVTTNNSDAVPPAFFEHLTRALTDAMGPVATLVVRDQVSVLGESMELFPKGRVKELLEAVSQEILDEKLKSRFREQMTEEMRILKSA
jgi:hypothetical protein